MKKSMVTLLWAVLAVIFSTTLAFSTEDGRNNTYENLLKIEPVSPAPIISTAKLLAQPENQAIYDLFNAPVAHPTRYKGKRIAIVTTDGVEEIELIGTRQYFLDRGADVKIISPPMPSVPDKFGLRMPEIRSTHILTIRYIGIGGWVKFDQTIDKADPAQYDAVMIPGGVWNPDVLRADERVLKFVKAVAAANKPVSAICHGPWVLGDAGLLKGKKATSWWAMKKDIEGAGGIFIDQPVVVDGNIITSRAPIDLALFLKTFGNAILK